MHCRGRRQDQEGSCTSHPSEVDRSPICGTGLALEGVENARTDLRCTLSARLRKSLPESFLYVSEFVRWKRPPPKNPSALRHWAPRRQRVGRTLALGCVPTASPRAGRVDSILLLMPQVRIAPSNL